MVEYPGALGQAGLLRVDGVEDKLVWECSDQAEDR